jgi:uncharacterized RDD family membrane protein YckC
MSTIRVHTTQNVTLEYEIAGLGERIIAALLDYLITGAWVAAWALIAILLKINDEAAIILIFIVAGIPYVFYNLLCEVFFNGQSLGKKARDIRVVRLDGTAPRLGDYLLRWLLRLVDVGLFSGLVAVITIALSSRGQRLGDMAAGTTVVSIRPRPEQAVALGAHLAQAGYQVVFPQAAMLADHDVATIRQLVQRATTHENYLLLNEVATKVKTLTGIQTDLPDQPFLDTVLRDHAYLATNG